VQNLFFLIRFICVYLRQNFLEVLSAALAGWQGGVRTLRRSETKNKMFLSEKGLFLASRAESE